MLFDRVATGVTYFAGKRFQSQWNICFNFYFQVIHLLVALISHYNPPTLALPAGYGPR